LTIVRYIAKANPEAARRVAQEIFDPLMGLPSLPFRGRKREEDPSREIVFAPWPYMAVYETIGDRIYVKAIRHTARDRAH